MKHIPLLLIGFITFLTLLSGCASISTTPKVVTTVNPSHLETAKTPDVTLPSGAVIPSNEYRLNFSGIYTIGKCFNPVRGDISSVNDIVAIEANDVSYTGACASYGTDKAITNPFYKNTVMTATQFQSVTNVPLTKIGISSPTVNQVTIFTDKTCKTPWYSDAAILYYTNNKNIVLFIGNYYFQLDPVK